MLGPRPPATERSAIERLRGVYLSFAAPLATAIVVVCWLLTRPADVARVPFAAAWLALVIVALAAFALGVATLPPNGSTRQRLAAADPRRLAALGALLVGSVVIAAGVQRVAFHASARDLALFGAAVVLAYGVGAAASLAVPSASRLSMLLAVTVLAAWILTDVSLWGRPGAHLYDMNVYLGSAARWLHGGEPYMTAPIDRMPAAPTADYFLYPPPLLPVFAALSRLPSASFAMVWIVALVAAAYAGFRLVGVSWYWAAALVVSPMVMRGVESGNVASIAFLLFALGVRAPASLVVNGLFKAQSAIPALWLIRERRWRSLAAGVATLAAVALVTLPIVGLGAWRTWAPALGFRAESQPHVPVLYGVSLAASWPGVVFVAVSLLAVVAALVLRGRHGLAALGLAEVVASPTLWLHGFAFAVPALLTLESGVLVWLVLGLGGLGSFVWLPVIVGAGALALSAAGARRAVAASSVDRARAPEGLAVEDGIHPVPAGRGPWPELAGDGRTGMPRTSPRGARPALQ